MQALLSAALEAEIVSMEDELIATRRYLHANPELSFQEYNTSQYIYDEMSKIPNIELTRLTKTSVVAKLVGAKPGKKIGLRADMDALAIMEDRPDLDFTSKNPGVMHACGHDGHTAILMQTMRFLSKHQDQIEGEIYGIFQHAEEVPPGGAQEMVKTGFFNDFDFIYGQHLFTPFNTGVIDLKVGPNTSNSDVYKATIIGKGGHAAIPEETIDPIVVASAVVQQIQAIVSRMNKPQDPLVISTTVFQAGSKTADNVIPMTAELVGSVRSLMPETRQLAEEKIEQIIQGVCAAYGATYEYEFVKGYSSVMNNEVTTAIVSDMVDALYPDARISLPCSLGGEDFSAFSSIVPSTFAWVGCRNEALGFDYPHHHPKFGIDEDSLLIGFRLMATVALNYSKLA